MEPRVLVVTSSAPLVIGLTFLPQDWQVVSHRDPKELSGADVVVLDLGTTAAGLEVVRSAGDRPSAVVIGDHDADGMAPDGVEVLLRPYTIEELAQRIERLLRYQASPPPDRSGAPMADAAGPRVTDAPPGPDGAADPEMDLAKGPEAAGPAVADEDPAPQTPDDAPRRGLAARLLGRFAGPADAVTSGPAVGPERDEAHSGLRSVVGELSAEDVTLPEGQTVPPPGEGERADPLWEDAPAASEPVALAPDPALVTGPPPPPPPPAAEPTGVVSDMAPATEPSPPDEPASTAVVQRSLREAPTATTGGGRTSTGWTRWRARQQPHAQPEDEALRTRLARVLLSISELEQLVEQVPLLLDLDALAHALVREAVVSLEADSVGLWRKDERGWRVAASHGFTAHERRWVVAPDQPLFAEVDATGGAMLIDPVDELQAAVAGIGGAHTESFMAASISVGPGRYGILAVGREVPLTAKQLDLLSDLVLEMAPGLAVAEQVASLRRIVTGPAADEVTVLQVPELEVPARD